MVASVVACIKFAVLSAIPILADMIWEILNHPAELADHGIRVQTTNRIRVNVPLLRLPLELVDVVASVFEQLHKGRRIVVSLDGYLDADEC